MEVSLLMNAKVEKMLPLFHVGNYPQNYSKVKPISCQAKNLTMQKVKPNFYEVLSLGSQNVGFEEIKKAYRRMALRYHPDVSPLPTKEESTRRFVELQKAYETLSVPVLRMNYDYKLGFADSFGCSRLCGLRNDEKSADFNREVWERQLRGLEKLSRGRMEKMKCKNI